MSNNTNLNSNENNSDLNDDNSSVRCSETETNTNRVTSEIISEATGSSNSSLGSDDTASNNNDSVSENINTSSLSEHLTTSVSDVAFDNNTTESNNEETEESSSETSTPKKCINLQILTQILVIAWTIVTGWASINWTGYGEDWDHIFKTHSIFSFVGQPRWKNTLNKIRLNESREYILDLMHDPPQVSEICYTKSKNNIEYRKDIYVNRYFSLFCIYTNDTLQGFLVIGNKENFNLKSYRGNIELFSDTIATASDKCEEMEAYRNMISISSTARYDRNSYYVEGWVQHSEFATPYTIIGYGCCSISNTVDIVEPQYPKVDLQTPNIEHYYDNFRFNNYSSLGWTWEDYVDHMHIILENDEVEKFRNDTQVNTFFIFNDNVELLEDALVSDNLGISTDAYYNLCDDYMKILEDNRKRIEEYQNELTQNTTTSN